jgi:hypothetical protein
LGASGEHQHDEESGKPAVPAHQSLRSDPEVINNIHKINGRGGRDYAAAPARNCDLRIDLPSRADANRIRPANDNRLCSWIMLGPCCFPTSSFQTAIEDALQRHRAV